MTMFTKMMASCVTIGALVLLGPLVDAVAAEKEPLNAAILRLALDWEHIKFEVENRDVQEQQMAGLAQRAAEMARQYQDRPAATIWYGIILSEQASMAGENGSPFKALGFAKQARDLLDKAEKIDPIVLDAGAPTSLGVLYYRVPGFPIGFGDKAKARRYLEEAIRNAPKGLDANYFYGDFLVEQREYPQAETVLKRVQTLPAHPDRPIWDRERRLVAQDLLAKIAAK
jgi:tetratricopeptide (TPR) repeat protein